MKKDTMRALIVAAIILVVYTLIAFVIPFEHTEAFWISYVFTLVSFVVAASSIYISFVVKPDARSRFYRFPIARIGVVYSILQVVVSLIVMILAAIIPWWIPTLIYAIGLGAAVLGLVAAEAVVDQIQTMDTKLKKDVAVMRALQSKMIQLAEQSDDKEIRALAEEFRYSDPVSNPSLERAEADLAAAIHELQGAYVQGDKEGVSLMCKKTSAILSERNRLCKLTKN